jgi:hypothetical protein
LVQQNQQASPGIQGNGKTETFIPGAHPNRIGSSFLAGGTATSVDLFVGEPLFGVVAPLTPLTFPGIGAGAGEFPLPGFLRMGVGGRPINLETVHGSSNPAAIAKAMYRASSRWRVG